MCLRLQHLFIVFFDGIEKVGHRFFEPPLEVVSDDEVSVCSPWRDRSDDVLVRLDVFPRVEVEAAETEFTCKWGRLWTRSIALGCLGF